MANGGNFGNVKKIMYELKIPNPYVKNIQDMK